MALYYTDVPSVCKWIEKNYDQLRWVSASYGKLIGQMSWLICAGEEEAEVWKKRFSDTFPEFRFECLAQKANVAGTRWKSLKGPQELALFVWKKEMSGTYGSVDTHSETPRGILKRTELK